MALRLYNTLTKKKEAFRPFKPKRVNLFVCGPTVYDWSHIGHARTYLSFDMLVRYLRAIGYKVFFLENITDISDKIISRAKKTGEAPRAIAKRFEKAFLEDMHSLGIASVTRYARASDFIPEIIAQVERLIRKGYAYEVKGNVYFRVRKFRTYGKLSRQNINKVSKFYKNALSGSGESEPVEGKEDDIDFALWKTSQPDEPRWKSPWGWGRPGWHIEDTAISEKFFGPQYDIHGGGIDLIFPHHDCEIAQQESASGRRPFVRVWLHTGHLKIGGEKMSKSLGNFLTIRELLKTTDPETFRLFIAQTHYRSPVRYTESLLSQAAAARRRLIEFVKRINEPSKTSQGDKLGTKSDIAKARKGFYDALADDFNAPKAIAAIFTLINKLNPSLEKHALPEASRLNALKLVKEVDQIFGIIGKVKRDATPSMVRKLAHERELFRKNRNWAKADELREKLRSLGWNVEDTPAGPKLKKTSSE